jgi:hypothetical protein
MYCHKTIHTKYTKRCPCKDFYVEPQDQIPGGYQPKLHNPGSSKFYIYDYNQQTASGKPLEHHGKSWEIYKQTGYFGPIRYNYNPCFAPNRYY